jgi:hypothetical protein
MRNETMLENHRTMREREKKKKKKSEGKDNQKNNQKAKDVC